MNIKEMVRKIKRTRHKLARVTLGLTACERRIRHHKRRWHHYGELLKQAGNDPALEKRLEAKRDRARHYTRKWQRRQSKLRDKHIYLQTLLDKRQRKKAKWLREHPQPDPDGDGLATFDGKTAAAWIVQKILIPARASGYWNGYLISGYRDPAYSEQLCYGICHQPSCPGLCAGRDSRHSQKAEPDGAVDVTDAAGLIAYCKAHGITFHGNGEVLPSDRNHCSTTGN